MSMASCDKIRIREAVSASEPVANSSRMSPSNVSGRKSRGSTYQSFA